MATRSGFASPVSGFRSPVSGLRLALCALPLGWLWFVLVSDLHVEWTVNPQYSYGWAVPFLGLFLLVRKIRNRESQLPTSNFHLPASISQLLFWLLALLYLPTRLIQEANPGWRLVSWALALEVVGLTLALLHLTVRGSTFTLRGYQVPLSAFRFPLFFFLVAVPWPTLLESPLIQALTRMDVSATCELVGWLGIPALPHGNVIQVATGMVGIDEACSGIRSFQATLMISLFLGEFYRLGVWRRMVCVAAGFALALLLNLARQTVLVWVAAREGIPAIARWHDPTGVTILLGCFFALWGIGMGLAPKRAKAESGKQMAAGRLSEISAFRFPLSALALIVWLVLVEAGVEGWYRWHEARLPAAVQWQVAWPTNNPTFKDQEIAPATEQILRYDQARNATWQEDNLGCQMIFLQWKPGRAAVRLAQNHTPEVCLTAAGHQIAGGNELQHLSAHGLNLPFRFYQITDLSQPVFVAYCLWDDRAGSQDFATSTLTYGRRLAPVLAGQRNAGQRSLEIALTGADDPAAAQAAVQRLLEKIIAPIR